MKRIPILFTLLGLLFLASCKKSEVTNPLADYKNLSVGSYITLDSTINLNFSYNTPNSEVGITVNQYGSEVDSINVFVVKNSNSDPTQWKLVKSVKFTGKGTKLAATAGEVATALGIAVSEMEPGNYFTFYNRVVTKDGRRFDISNTPGALESNSNYKTAFRWQAYVTCAFTGNMAGSYTVIQDDWADWSPGDIVTVSDGPGPNQIDLSEVWPNPAYGDVVDHLVVDVDPANGSASLTTVNFGDYGSIAKATEASGYVFSCTGFITLTIHLYYGGTDYGDYKLVLQKN